MTVGIRVAHQDEALLPWQQWASIRLADLATTREYVLGHPVFPVAFRAKPMGRQRGYAREWCYPGEFQLRQPGRPWPSRWVETSDMIGVIHEMCFDQMEERYIEAMASVQRHLDRALRRFGIEPEWPVDYMEQARLMDAAVTEHFSG